MPHWTEDTFIGFDTETTGTDPKTARILQSAIVTDDPLGALIEEDRILHIDPEIDIPPDAAAVHGITREKLKALSAWPSAQGIPFVENLLQCRALRRRYPIVIFNATYDLPLLFAEMERCGIPRWSESAMILDPLVIDRYVDRYRKGGRKLSEVAAIYGVKVENAHDAAADARTAIGIMRALIRRYSPYLACWTLDQIQRVQAGWYAEWRDHINEYWKRNGKPDRIEGEWPLGRTQ